MIQTIAGSGLNRQCVWYSDTDETVVVQTACDIQTLMKLSWYRLRVISRHLCNCRGTDYSMIHTYVSNSLRNGYIIADRRFQRQIPLLKDQSLKNEGGVVNNGGIKPTAGPSCSPRTQHVLYARCIDGTWHCTFSGSVAMIWAVVPTYATVRGSVQCWHKRQQRWSSF